MTIRAIKVRLFNLCSLTPVSPEQKPDIQKQESLANANVKRATAAHV